MSESDQTPPEPDFESEYYRDRPGADPSRREKPPGHAVLPARTKLWWNTATLSNLRVRVGALIAVLVAVGFIIWAAVGGGGSSSPSPASQSSVPNTAAGPGPVALSLRGLKTVAATLQHPIYWLGAKSGTKYEFRQLTNGIIYLRYLPGDAQAGDSRALLTVGTYPMQNAYSITKSLAQKSGAVTVDPGHGGVGFYTERNPSDAYVAFPGSDYQIEVYSPVNGAAREAVARGILTSVPAAAGAPRLGVRGITPAGLRALAKNLRQPIYWVGRRPGTTLEVTQTSGRLYVRYLPAGVTVGAPGPYLTIGTYAVKNAFAATSGLSKQAGNTSLKVAGGGIAAFGKGATVKNVYVAFPGADYQIEVFDPTPGIARKLIASGRLLAIR